jgi:hypothetical protein
MTKLSAKVVNALVSVGEQTSEQSAIAADELGFTPRTLISACLPYSRVNGTYYSVTNGHLRFSMIAPADIGLPYGAKARLIVLFLVTEAVRTKQREIALGRSLSEFMARLGLDATGGKHGSIHNVKDQMLRLFSSSINACWSDGRAIEISNSTLAQSARLWWSNESKPANLTGGSVILGEQFFIDATERPVPIDLRAIRALKRSALALDIYSWLTYRMSYLNLMHSRCIPWRALLGQFGNAYASDAQGLVNFRHRFCEQLQKVLLVYPAANVQISLDGVTLRPSPPHVKRRFSRTVMHA